MDSLIAQLNEKPRAPSARSFAVVAAQDDEEPVRGSGSGLSRVNYT
jgi:hypothetical protein